MNGRDNKKVYKNAIDTYEMYADMKPSKKIRKYKRKERQDGKKEIRKQLNG